MDRRGIGEKTDRIKTADRQTCRWISPKTLIG